MSRWQRWLARIGRVIVVIAVIFLVVYLGIYLWSLLMPPLEPLALSLHPNPAATFDEAMTRFDALLAEEKAPVGTFLSQSACP